MPIFGRPASTVLAGAGSSVHLVSRSAFEIWRRECPAGKVETDDLRDIPVEGDKLLRLRRCPAPPDSILGVGLESDGAVLLSPSGTSLDGDSEQLVDWELWLVCAAMCSLSRRTS